MGDEEGGSRGPKGASPGTRLVRRRESNKVYELSRKKRGTIRVHSEVFERWSELRGARGLTNDQFLSLLLDMSEEKEVTTDSEQSVVTGANLSMKTVQISTPGKDGTEVQVLLDSSSDDLSMPSSLHSKHSSDDLSMPSSLHSKQPVSGAPSSPPQQEELDIDNADVHDISVSFAEVGDYIYPHEEEDIVDDDDSDFAAEVLLQRRPEDIAFLRRIGEDEEVLGEQDELESSVQTTRSGLHIKVSPEEASDLGFVVISKPRLKQLAKEAYPTCAVCGAETTATVHDANGSAGHVTWVCPKEHERKFCSQEVLGRSHVGDVRLGSSILLSGNNFQKIQLLFRFSKLNFMSQRTFHALQAQYAIPAVEACWKGIQDTSITKHKATPVVVCGDARNDSPGHCAQYCTYTFMEHETNDVLHVGFVDKREVGMKSNVMEAKAFKEGLSIMEERGLQVKEVVTDAHPSIGKYMRESKPEVKHSWDVWHGAKNLAKKLAKASSKASTRSLLYWVKHIIRHFWYCSKTCRGNLVDLKAKWHGLTHHVTNQHSWVAGFGGAAECAHGDLEEREEWLERGGDPHRALVQVCYDKRFLTNLGHYVNYRHTSMLESLHNHILMYASKRFSFRYPGYRARNLLAVIDFMSHKDRPYQTNADGTRKKVAVWSKHAGDYVAVRVKVPKTYDYIEPLMKDIFVRKATDEGPMFRRATIGPDDPRLIRPRLAPFPAPPIDEILARRRGRNEVEESEVD
nr:uncharacterized protein LOC129262527 isoform X1 [Lytechinus pictus]